MSVLARCSLCRALPEPMAGHDEFHVPYAPMIGFERRVAVCVACQSIMRVALAKEALPPRAPLGEARLSLGEIFELPPP